MKKTKQFSIYLLLFIATFSYSQTIDIKNFKINEILGSNYSQGTKFDYEFEIKGDYTYATHGHHQIDLIVYYESISNNREIGRIYWNREDDINLIFNSYTKKNTWVTSLINYTTNPGKKFILVAKYGGVTKQYTYTIPDGDNDGDGVTNSQDNCPNEAGPSSNNGCPTFPNLTVDLDVSQVFSQCLSCFPWLDLFFNSGKRHLIANGGVGSLNFNKLEIRNIGSTTSNSARVKFYFSLNNSIGNTDKLLKTVNIPSRNVNSSFGISTSINGWDINNNGGLANGNYFILVDIDSDNSNNESTDGEADNLLVIPITYTEQNITSIISPFPNSISRQKTADTQFELTVYNSQGTLITEKTIANKKEENEFIQSLPKGFYIIKNNNRTYKVSK